MAVNITKHLLAWPASGRGYVNLFFSVAISRVGRVRWSVSEINKVTLVYHSDRGAHFLGQAIMCDCNNKSNEKKLRETDPTQSQILLLPATVKPNKWERQSLEQRRFMAVSRKENGWLVLENLDVLDGLGEGFLIGKFWGKRCRPCDFLLIGWWWGIEKLLSSTLVETFVWAEELKDTVMCIHQEESGPCPEAVLLFIDCSSSVSVFLPFPD